MICVVVALPAEARPLATRWDLRAMGQGDPFRIWRGEEAALIVSGVGKTAAAAAVDHLRLRFAESSIGGWLNVGIGGHRSLALGTPILAREIEDGASGERWFPTIRFPPLCRTGRVLTVERVERLYAEDVIYDMEASGFYGRAVRDGDPARVQVLKVVSDNQGSDVGGLSAAAVEEFIKASAETVEELISALLEGRMRTNSPP